MYLDTAESFFTIPNKFTCLFTHLTMIVTIIYSKGLAIRDYWSLGKEDQKDDKYIVLVVDQFGGRGNILNFNVGDVSGSFF